MRHLLAFFLIFGLSAASVWAEDSASVYEVTGVVADVTSDSAAHARDQAILQAQHTAFATLLERLGADAAMAAKVGDNELDTLVKSFEMQNERASAVHYIGTFTVRFRQAAVRAFLEKRDATYTDTPSTATLVLPVTKTDGIPTLWGDKTKWWAAWDHSTLNEGLVPIVLPQDSKEDGDLLPATAAIKANAAVKPLIDKYHAGGAVVALFNINSTKPDAGYKIDLLRYDGNGNSMPAISITLPASTDMDSVYAQGVKSARAQLEKSWRMQALSGNTPGEPDVSQEPSEQLLVNVPVANLTEWTQIKHRLESVPDVATINVLALQRGHAQIELGYRGGIDALQSGLKQANLSLSMDNATGSWILQPVATAN